MKEIKKNFEDLENFTELLIQKVKSQFNDREKIGRIVKKIKEYSDIRNINNLEKQKEEILNFIFIELIPTDEFNKLTNLLYNHEIDISSEKLKYGSIFQLINYINIKKNKIKEDIQSKKLNILVFDNEKWDLDEKVGNLNIFQLANYNSIVALTGNTLKYKKEINFDTNFMSRLFSSENMEESIKKSLEYIFSHEEYIPSCKLYLYENGLNDYELDIKKVYKNLLNAEFMIRNRTTTLNLKNISSEDYIGADKKIKEIRRLKENNKKDMKHFKIIYCMLLYAFYIKRIELRKSGLKKLVVNYIEFLEKEKIPYLENELLLCFKFFENKAETFFRVQLNSNEIFEEIKGMSWDLIHLRYLERDLKLKNNIGSFPYIATLDKGLTDVLKNNPIKIFIYDAEGDYLVIRESNVFLEFNKYGNILEKISKDKEETTEYYEKLAKKLECLINSNKLNNDK